MMHGLPPNRKLLIYACGLMVVAGLGCAAQTSSDGSQDIHLDIAEKRITESPFERSLRVNLNSGDVRLLVGVGATSDRVDITLRGVRGDVRFRVSLDEIRERLTRRRQ